jgi:hypothetical protein
MTPTFRPLAPQHVRLTASLFKHRSDLNRKYLMSLLPEHLLQNYYNEAGLLNIAEQPASFHWGWESPTCQVRGHFLGHWLSGAARLYASTGDGELKARGDFIVAELGRCQKQNGGEWVSPTPEKYLDWIARGTPIWAPHYVHHKTGMGLYEMYKYAGSDQALEILINFAKWFHRWTAKFSRAELDQILDHETGGMLELWSDLYGVTGKQEHLDLMHCYDRPRLFDPLRAGKDVLTNMHANTTIPEAHGACRAFEVTGEKRWREIAEAYWKCAVSDRGYYCTGGQTLGEIWTPPFQQSARLGAKTQEHCTVYNMMRLAEYFLRWTGAAEYADYWERNLCNGVLAQQHPDTGMIAYWLPLSAGGVKKWGTPTETFWCCHGTLVQANASHHCGIYYEDDDGLAVCQSIPSELAWRRGKTNVQVALTHDRQAGQVTRPKSWAYELKLKCDRPTEFTLKLRMPAWLAGRASVTINGKPERISGKPPAFAAVRRTWSDDTLRVELPKALTVCPLPDKPDTVAFLDGPVVLAGLCDEERMLTGDPRRPETLLTPDNEREWGDWHTRYRTHNQDRGIRFLPLYEVRDERYTVYFPVRAAPGRAAPAPRRRGRR